MRKVLSIVLALAMVLGCFASVFAAEFTDVKADDDFATAVSVLTDLGVVSGYTDGTYRPEKVVNRAEMAALLIKALGLTPSASSTTNFSDVPASHWASGYVAYANSLGIIAGYTDGTFKPSKTVSYDEAVTMIVQALGYTADSLEGTTWPTAFIMKAQQLKITKGVDLLGSAGANRGDIVELLYNTLTVDLGKTNKDGEFVKNSADATKPDNMLTRLGAKLGAKKVILGTEDAAIELAEYVGKYVQTYTDEDGIVAVVVLSTTLEGKMSSDGKKFADTAFATSVDESAKVQFVNGEKGTCANADATVMEVALTNGKISAIYSVQKWAGTTGFAGKTAYDAKKFTLTVTKIDDTTLTAKFATKDKALDTASFVLEGADSVDAIEKDAVVTVYEGAVSGTITKVAVSTKVVTGKLESRTADKITVAGTAYKFNGSGLTLGSEHNVYFDAADKVFTVKPVEANVSDKAYAVVLEANYESTGDGWSGTTATVTRQVKLLLATGEEVIYDVYTKTTPTTNTLEFASRNDAKNWANGIANKIVTFTLKDGKLDSCIAATSATTTSAAISKKGVLEGKYFTTDAVAFVWDSTEKEYTVLTADKLAGLSLDGAAKYIVDTTKGQIAVLYTGAAEADADAVYGIYTGEWSEAKTGVYTLSFYVDGQAVTYTAEKKNFDELTFAKLTFSGETLTTVAAVTGVTATTGGAVIGNTYKDATGDCAVDAAAIFYIYDSDEKEITIGTMDDLKSEDNTSIELFDTNSTPDKVFDVVFIKR